MHRLCACSAPDHAPDHAPALRWIMLQPMLQPMRRPMLQPMRRPPSDASVEYFTIFLELITLATCCLRICRYTYPPAAREGGFSSRERHRSSVVEHTLGKGEVEGSIPFGGFRRHSCWVSASVLTSAHQRSKSQWLRKILIAPSPM